MSAVVKAPRTKSRVSYTIRLRPTTPKRVVEEISTRYADFLVTDDSVDITGTDWYRGISMTPGETLKTIREAVGMTQVALANHLRLTPGRVCDIEAGRRNASKAVAKQLSALFGLAVEKFI